MYNEIKFLFNIDNSKMTNKIGEHNIDLFPKSHDYDKLSDETKAYNENIDPTPYPSRINTWEPNSKKNIVVRYKGDENINNNKIRDFLNSTSYSNNDNDSNPYIKLIEKLNMDNSNNSLKFGYKELSYLTNLGVYPLNRMIILRRFSEGVEVKHNLNEMDIEPISTVIGWLNPEEEKSLSIGFSEKWNNQTKFFWDQISEIVKLETGIELKNTAPSPGWAQGFLFNFLNKAGLVPDGYDPNQIPVGDPNVLKESPTREIDTQGLDSTFSISFETSYEQKFINDIDPGSAYLDIIHNSLRMGTSDMNFFLGGKAKELMATFNSDSDNYINAAFESLKVMAGAFLNATKEMLGEFSNLSGLTSRFSNSDSGATSEFLNTSFIVSGLNAALYRFRWPLRSSLAVTTGQHTTPWHVTIGHPLNPIISMGNIILADGSIEFNNEMGFNDIPTNFKLTFNIKQGRNLGKQEIMEILNNSYGRVYNPPSN